MTSQTNSLNIVNRSGSTWDMCLYQLFPDVGAPGRFPVAWFVRPTPNNVTVQVTWFVDQWSFVWAETGALTPGKQFESVQAWPADPSIREPAGPTEAGNCVGFTRDEGVYAFFELPSEPSMPAGQLQIMNDSTVAVGEVSIGIGNSGSPVVAVQAAPNINEGFSPLHPAYFIAAGSFQQGEVLDVAAINNSAEIVFPPNIDCMTAVLEPDLIWHIEPAEQSLDSVHETSMVTP